MVQKAIVPIDPKLGLTRRSVDYSWDGLAEIFWSGWRVAPDGALVERDHAPPGARRATLQDYWRDEAAHLIEGDGKQWTRAHCPLIWANGAPTPKANWSPEERAAYAEMLARKLEEAAATEFTGLYLRRRAIGADRRAQFEGCIFFEAPKRRDGGPLSVFLDGALFAETAQFSDVTFLGDAGFGGVLFAKDANFNRAVFSGEAVFDDVMFLGAAIMDGAKFTGEAGFERVRCRRDARYENTVFEGEARFNNAQFSSYAGFDNARFLKIAHFDKVRFEVSAHFNRATFEADARFERAFFGGEVDFHHAVFMRPALFGAAAFPSNASDFYAAFRGARFVDVADFGGAGAHFIAAFDEAILDRKLLLDEPGEGASDRAFRDAVFQGIAGSNAMVSRSGGAGVSPQERLLKELEGGCRTVKVSMGRERDEVMEQRYYRYQLIARRRQAGTPIAEKFYSWLYAVFSDYGMGLWQPFATLLVLTLSFGGVYWVWGELLQPGAKPALFTSGALDQDVWHALLLSANNVFRPFGVWSSEFQDSMGSDWIRNFLVAFNAERAGGQILAIRLVATLQSILAVILFFLFGLAVRRRFQIG